MKKQVLTAVLLGAMTMPALALEFTGNAGVVSEYVFRGIPSSDGNAAAQGGLDVAWDSGFSLGTWASTVDFDGSDGVEIDVYGGYGGEIGEFGYSVGATLYTYTDDADDDYTEINLGGSWKWFSIDYAKGEYDNFTGPTLDYDFWSVSAEYEGLFATFGSFGDDFDGDYVEAGYGGTLMAGDEALFDYSISYIRSDDELLIGTMANSRLVFAITKGFDILN